MNAYLTGILVSLIVFTFVGVVAGRSVKTTNDYYVAGRRAPVILIVGSLVASFLSTGAFMGDTGEVYSGFFMGIIIVGIIQASGYVYGANLFGKYIRRAQVSTVPEYFGKRFASKRLRVLASIVLICAVAAYLLSVMQGISTLLTMITSLDYKVCVIIAWFSFTVFTCYSGAKGVLITDTIMFLLFTVAALISLPFIIDTAGGWFESIEVLARSTTRPGIISWTNNLNYLYSTGIENLIWGLFYGVVWAIVVMLSPWQTSRYLMAKDEHTVQRSAVWASIGVVLVTIPLYFCAAFIYKINPSIEPASLNLVWAAMNIMPLSIGVVLLTGILSAGISSASTFLSLIGSSVANDIMNHSDDAEKNLSMSRIVTFLVSLIVLILALFNPPQIFWVMYFGGTMIASAWFVVALASVWSRSLTEQSAFYAMLFGFFGFIVPRSYAAIKGITLPLYLDPFLMGIIMSIFGICIGRKSEISKEVLEQYKILHTRPTSEKDNKRDAVTYSLMYLYIIFGIAVSIFFLFFYAFPYNQAVNG